jgi:hypothetical protein
MYGTYAYLAQHEQRITRSLAAINMDMVGENQELCGSSFLVVQLPQAMAAPVDTLAIAIQEALAQEQHGLNDLGTFALFRYANTPFNGGSDHYILSDPSVGIPCPMLNEWPDRFYHTSFDTIDKVDPTSLRRAGLLAGTYAAFLAAAGGEETIWLAHEAQMRYKALIARSGHDAATAIHRIKNNADCGPAIAHDLALLHKRLLYLADRQQAILGWLERLGGTDVSRTLRSLQSEAATVAWNEGTVQTENISGIATRSGLRKLPAAAPRPLDEWETAAQEIVPQRSLRGPLYVDSYMARLSPERRDAWHAVAHAHAATSSALLDLALYWADGTHTLLDIADLLELETGLRDVEYLVLYMRLLRELELIA